MISLGMDASTTRVGISKYDHDTGIFKSGVKKFHKSERGSHLDMLDALYESIIWNEVQPLDDVDYIMVEDSLSGFGRLTNSIAMLIGWNAVLQYDLTKKHGIDVHSGHPSTIRKQVTNTGRKPKSFDGSTKEFYTQWVEDNIDVQEQCYYDKHGIDNVFGKHPTPLSEHLAYRTRADNRKPNLEDRIDSIIISMCTPDMI